MSRFIHFSGNWNVETIALKEPEGKSESQKASFLLCEYKKLSLLTPVDAQWFIQI
jgi:hypothetical protein